MTQTANGWLRGPWWVLLALHLAVFVWSEIDGWLVGPVSSHVSNFAATGLAVLLLLAVPPFRGWKPACSLAVVGLSVTAVSTALELFYEGTPTVSTDLDPGTTYFRFYNTPDLLDAAFGIASVALIAVVLVLAGDRRLVRGTQAQRPTDATNSPSSSCQDPVSHRRDGIEQ